jgi:hypothetical protein
MNEKQEQRWKHRIEVVRPARRRRRRRYETKERDPKIDYRDLDARLNRENAE